MGSIILGGRSVDFDGPTKNKVNIVPCRARRLTITQIILHHDACTSAEQCISVLRARKLGTHFVIGNDGTVIQLLDPIESVAEHARGKLPNGTWTGFNDKSIGIDISNAVELSKQASYKIPRPVVTESIQNETKSFLGPYPCQIEACLHLIRVLREEISSIGSESSTETKYLNSCNTSTPGVFGHFHINPTKIDPVGFPWERLQRMLKGNA